MLWWCGWLTAIDMEEMFSAMAATGVFTVEEIRETFAAADVDRNAMLSFSEFKQFFKVTAMLLLFEPRAISSLTNTLRCCRMCLELRSYHGGTLRVRKLVHSAVHGCNGKGDVCFGHQCQPPYALAMRLLHPDTRALLCRLVPRFCAAALDQLELKITHRWAAKHGWQVLKRHVFHSNGAGAGAAGRLNTGGC